MTTDELTAERDRLTTELRQLQAAIQQAQQDVATRQQDLANFTQQALHVGGQLTAYRKILGESNAPPTVSPSPAPPLANRAERRRMAKTNGAVKHAPGA